MTTQPIAPANPARGAPQQPSSLRMSGRDLINIGIFAALYVATVFMINLLGLINPLVMLVAICGSIVAGGVPFLLFITRVRHAGMVSLFGVIVGLAMFLAGHPPISLAVTIVMGIVADLVVWLGRYRSVRLGVISYAVFAVWFVGPMLPIFYAREDYFRSATMDQMGADYSTKLDALLSPGVLLGFDICTVIFGLLGGLLGVRLLTKHFRKAGLA